MDDLPTIALSNAVAAAVLAVVVAVVAACCRRPALIHGLWLLVLLKLLTPPLGRIPIAWPIVSESSPVDVVSFAVEEPRLETIPPPLQQPADVLVLPVTAEDESALATDAVLAPPAPASVDPLLWRRLLLLGWLAGSLAWFVLAVARLRRFHRLLRFARCTPAALQERTERLSRQVGLSRCPRVDLLPGRIAPMLWAVAASPRLLVPADLLDTLSAEQLDTLLVHELAHLRRRDHWVRVLEFVAMGLYWWNPVVWYARRELRESEEQCCDAWVVSTLPGAGRVYAAALMDTLDFLSTDPAAVPPLASGIGHVANLKRRFTMILRGTTPRALSWPGCLVVLVLGAFFLPLLPDSQAQAQKKEQTDEQKIKKIKATAKAEVEATKAAVEQAQANLEAARARAVMAVRAAEQIALTEKMRAMEAARAAKKSPKPPLSQGKKKPPMVRVEIVVSAKGLNVQELRSKIAKLLPGSKVSIQLEGVGGKVQTKPNIMKPNKPNTKKPTKPTTKKPPAASSQEKRIDDLEKKLEKVSGELHELRKHINKPKSFDKSTPR